MIMVCEKNCGLRACMDGKCECYEKKKAEFFRNDKPGKHNRPLFIIPSLEWLKIYEEALRNAGHLK